MLDVDVGWEMFLGKCDEIVGFGELVISDLFVLVVECYVYMCKFVFVFFEVFEFKVIDVGDDFKDVIVLLCD